MAEKPAAQDGADDASSEASGESGKSSEESQQDGGLEPGTQPAATGGPTLEQVRKKREAHARFMRFSRSLKSYLVANKSAKLMLNTVLVLLVCTSYSRLFVLTLAVLNSIHTFALFSWRGVNWIYWMFVATTWGEKTPAEIRRAGAVAKGSGFVDIWGSWAVLSMWWYLVWNCTMFGIGITKASHTTRMLMLPNQSLNLWLAPFPPTGILKYFLYMELTKYIATWFEGIIVGKCLGYIFLQTNMFVGKVLREELLFTIWTIQKRINC